MLSAGFVCAYRDVFSALLGDKSPTGTGSLRDSSKTVTNLCVICAKCTPPQFVPLKLIELSTTKRIRQDFLDPLSSLRPQAPLVLLSNARRILPRRR